MENEQLIDACDLLQHLDDPGWRVIDCRFDLVDVSAGRSGYLESHIPGAVFADLNADLAAQPTAMSGRHPLPSVSKATATFRRLGVSLDTRVVVYDAGNGAMAARCWWLLRWLGHDRVVLLNGGLSRWRALQLPLLAGRETVAASQFVAQPRPELVLTSDELTADGASIATMNLLDARDTARFRGEAEPIDAIAGHIPGARNQPFVSCLTEDGLFKPEDELATLMAGQLGPDKTVSWSVMCGSGVTACHLAIAGMQAGYREPRVYVGSWSEWIRDPARPIGLGQG